MAGERILVVDDNAYDLESMEKLLREEGYEVVPAPTRERGLASFRAGRFDLVLTDLWLPKAEDGLALLEEVKRIAPTTKVIVVTAYPEMDTAIQALHGGRAFDAVTKGANFAERLLHRVELAIRNLRLEHRVYQYDGVIIGESPAIKAAIETADRLIRLPDELVFISGPSGSGKGLFAKYIHFSDPVRSRGEFVSVNLGALTLNEELLWSELFGHVRGAFTGAIRDRQGKFELADGGTIFLDEIGKASKRVQAALLKAIREKRISRLGEDRERKVNVRIIAAANEDLRRAVEAGTFLWDLLNSLSRFRLEIPPLRDRREDVELLATHFARRFCAQYGIEEKLLSPAAIERLRAHQWDGNVMELENYVGRVVGLSPEQEIDEAELLRLVPELAEEQEPLLPLDTFLRRQMRAHLIHTLDRTRTRTTGRWNKAEACRVLNISKPTLLKYLEECGIPDEE